MASTASLEASELRRRGRRRLIGAIALVMLLVVFVPMVLDSEPRPERQAPALEIPSRDNAPALPAPTPAPPVAAKPQAEAPKIDSASAASPASSPAPAVVKPVEKPAAEKAAEKPAADKPGEKAAADKAAPKAAAAPRLEGFAVQVGAFRDEAKLRQAREKLAAAGVVHYTERLETSAGPLTRLRAGPFPTREAAEAAQSKLKRAAVEGKVVPLQ